MILRTTAIAAILLGAGCASTSVPDSNPNAGVGFSGYDTYATERARRDAELQAMRPSAIPDDRAIATETVAVLNQTRSIAGTAVASPSGEPMSAIPAQPVQTAGVATTALPVVSNPGISDEQNFDAVAGRESIESDAERLARQRQAYQVIAPQALPERSGQGGANIVAYALNTSNRIGEGIHKRGSVNTTKFQRNCARYASSDQAQQAFLESGGPERDRQGLDPDGDGFACFWDPTPFRAARGG